MINETENNIEPKNKLIIFVKENKIKLIILMSILVISVSSYFFFKIINEKKNILASEKYIQASLFISANEKTSALNLLDEIIKNKNKFYSILALNKIIENNLQNDKEKVLNYFKIVEKLSISKDTKDLLILKKALFLIKNSSEKDGNKLLNGLIESESKLKFIAKQILTK